MKILACDTSNSTCCAGVYEDGKELSYELSLEMKTHSETFMPLVERVLKNANTNCNDLDATAVTVGPGSFTGIRIGISSVLGIALGANLKCIPVSSTEALARSVENVAASPEDTILLPCFDARNKRVFAQVLTNDTYETLVPEGAYDGVALAEELSGREDIRGKVLLVIGSGAKVMSEFLKGDDFSKLQYAAGAVILPKGVYHASQNIEPVSPEEIHAKYCAVSQAERFSK